MVITGETGADPRSYRVDFSRFRAALPGFDCAVDGEGRARSNSPTPTGSYGLTREDFERRFTRLAVLRAASDAGAVDDTLRWRR